jgi:hypothetical protein
MIEESNEAKLLKLLIGYVHVMAVNNLAVVRHQKSFVDLTEAEKGSLNAEVSGGAMGVAGQIGAIIATPKGETPPVVN